MSEEKKVLPNQIDMFTGKTEMEQNPDMFQKKSKLSYKEALAAIKDMLEWNTGVDWAVKDAGKEFLELVKWIERNTDLE